MKERKEKEKKEVRKGSGHAREGLEASPRSWLCLIISY
jgi:hypothetical protein